MCVCLTSLPPLLIPHRPYGDALTRIELIGGRIKKCPLKPGARQCSVQTSNMGTQRLYRWNLFILAAEKVKWRHTLLTAVVIKRRRGAKGNWRLIISNWLGWGGGGGGSARQRLMTPFMPERDRGADRLKVALVGNLHWCRARNQHRFWRKQNFHFERRRDCD